MLFFTRAKTRTNPVFWAHALRIELADEPERLERILTDPDSIDLLTWNIFGSLDTHRDPEWLAYRLQAFGGSAVRAPVRLSLWTGRTRLPLLEPSRAYLAWVRQRSQAAGGDEDDIAAFAQPAEVPVRIESPDVLVLVETTLGALPRGAGGRDRLQELIDGGLEQARRLGRPLAVAVVYRSGTQVAAELSERLNRLRDPAILARELPWRPQVPPLLLREVGWQQLIKVWETELGDLDMDGQPVRAFLGHLSARGLR